MHISSIDRLSRSTAVHAIALYQRQLSPRKGFSCPHRILYGEASCSEYVKDLLLHQSLKSAVRQSFQRFHDCNAASRTLQAQSQGGCIVIPCCIPL